MSVGQGEPPRGSSGIGVTLLWIALVISLAGNAFFIGASWRGGSWIVHRAPGGSDMMLSPRAFMSELSPATRQNVLAELRAHRAEFGRRFADLVASRRAVLDAMKKEPFDVEAYRKALENSAKVDATARDQAIDFFVGVVQQMTPQERRAVAERLERRGSHWGRRDWRRGRREHRPPPGGPDAPEP